MERIIIFAIATVVGAILGSWLVVPLLFGKRTKKETVAIGRITAIITAIIIVLVFVFGTPK